MVITIQKPVAHSCFRWEIAELHVHELLEYPVGYSLQLHKTCDLNYPKIISNYPPQTKFRSGNVFTLVLLSTARGGMVVPVRPSPMMHPTGMLSCLQGLPCVRQERFGWKELIIHEVGLKRNFKSHKILHFFNLINRDIVGDWKCRCYLRDLERQEDEREDAQSAAPQPGGVGFWTCCHCISIHNDSLLPWQMALWNR